MEINIPSQTEIINGTQTEAFNLENCLHVHWHFLSERRLHLI